MNARDIRQSILMAADKIERFPTQFDFLKSSSPRDSDGCGCVLGWIGYFMGMRDACNGFVTKAFIDTYDTSVFYNAMSEIAKHWQWDAAVCSATMRRYADKYFPNEVADEPEPSGTEMEATFVRELLRSAV